MGFFKYIRHYLCLCKIIILQLFVSHCHCCSRLLLEKVNQHSTFCFCWALSCEVGQIDELNHHGSDRWATAASVSFIKDNCSVTQITLRKYYQLRLCRKWKGKWNHQRHIKLPMNCQNNNNKHTSEKPFFKVPCVLLLFSPETSYFVRNQIQVHSIWNCSWIFNIFMFLE